MAQLKKSLAGSAASQAVVVATPVNHFRPYARVHVAVGAELHF